MKYRIAKGSKILRARAGKTRLKLGDDYVTLTNRQVSSLEDEGVKLEAEPQGDGSTSNDSEGK